MELFDFRPCSWAIITDNYSKWFVDIFLHGAKHSLAATLFTRPTGDPGGSPGLCSGSSMSQGGPWRNDFKQEFARHRRAWFFALIPFYSTRVFGLGDLICLVEKFGRNLMVTCLNILVSWIFFPISTHVRLQTITGSYSTRFADICLHGAKHFFAAKQFSSPNGDPAGSIALCSGSSVSREIGWRTDFKQEFRRHHRAWFFALIFFLNARVLGLGDFIFVVEEVGRDLEAKYFNILVSLICLSFSCFCREPKSQEIAHNGSLTCLYGAKHFVASELSSPRRDPWSPGFCSGSSFPPGVWMPKRFQTRSCTAPACMICCIDSVFRWEGFRFRRCHLFCG